MFEKRDRSGKGKKNAGSAEKEADGRSDRKSVWKTYGHSTGKNIKERKTELLNKAVNEMRDLQKGKL